MQASEDVRRSKEYKKYLASERWASKRDKVMGRENGLCEGCREEPATEVHHLTYEHLFDEFLFELAALCTTCHSRWHEDEASARDNGAGDEELACCACRFQQYPENGEMPCGVHEEPSRIALSEKGRCGLERGSFEPLK